MFGTPFASAHTCNLKFSTKFVNSLSQKRSVRSCQVSHCLRQKYSRQEKISHSDKSNFHISAYTRWALGHPPRLASESLKGLLSGLLAAALLLFSSTAVGAVTTSQDKNDSLTIKFKASKNPAIREAQEALVQTWGYASTQFLDPTFNGVNWPQQLQVQL